MRIFPPGSAIDFTGRGPMIAATFDRDAVAWQRAVLSGGGSVSAAQLGRVSTLVKSLKSAGVWSSLDRLWLFASENSTQALTDLVARATATAVNSPTFTAARGYQGSHLSAYINSNFNPSTAGGHYTQNGASYGFWVETADSNPSGSFRLMGNDSSNYSEIVTGATDLSIQVNQGSPNGASSILSTATGLVTGSRTAASGAGSVNYYLNGVSGGSGSTSTIALPNNNFNILAGNNAGTAYQQSDAREAAAYIGGGMSAAQVAALYASLRAYMTSVGVA